MSGLAKGVDTEALTAAIEGGGKVAAVIGTPIDTAYPAENKAITGRDLQESLARVFLVSAYTGATSRSGIN
jgi:DNA processing protein